MVPDPTRRRLLSSISLAFTLSVAGCIDAVGGGTDETGATTTTTERRTTTSSEDGTETITTTSEQSTTGRQTTTSDGRVVGSPAETVRSYIEARSQDPLEARQYFHPVHPFRSERVEAETAKTLLSLDGEVDDVQLDTRQQDVGPEEILSSPLLNASDVKRETVDGALEGAQTVLVETTVRMTDGSRRTNPILTVTANGKWVILAQGIEPIGGSTDPFGGRVVTDVTFDTETDRARVYFDDSLTADRLTAKAKERYSERSSSTPGAISYFDVRLDPSGDELIVTATVNGKTRPIHRERYPPSDRLVDDVTFIKEPGSNDFDAAFRVSFNGGESNETVVVASTVEGDTATKAPVNAGSHLIVGAVPSGDELIVEEGHGDQSEIIHQERHVS